jgi:glycine/D-amino acid oxidase-like deaminating enzyme
VTQDTANLWRHTTTPPLECPTLCEDLSADAIVVGGGFTGCAAALHLAEAGAKVCLLESETIGHGGAGRNVGLVNAGLWTPPDGIEAKLGKTEGSRLNTALANGPALVFDLIERHGVECDAVQNGTLHCAHNKQGLADLRERYAQQRARNAPVELLGADETARRTGTDKYLGALLDRRAGTIQPLSYVRGLARAAIGGGAKFFEHSPAREYHHKGSAWYVKTPRGAVTAPTLIEATDAYEVRDSHAPAYTPLYFFQCATAPLSHGEREKILPGGEGCWDTALVMSSFRTDASGRLVLGGLGNIEGQGKQAHLHWVRRQLKELFPALVDRPWEHAWCGRIAMTADFLPRVFRIGPNAIAIYGYSGRGIAPGTVFGRAAAKWAQSGDEAVFPCAPVEAPAEHFTSIKGTGIEGAAAIYHLVDARS